MYRVRRIAGVAIAGLIPLIPVLCLLGCGREPEQEAPVPSPEMPVQVVEGMVLRESQGGRLRWVLQADSAFHYGEDEQTLLSGIFVEFYDEQGDSVRSWLTAREGQVDPETRDLIARDSVLVRTWDGDMLETQELRYDHRRGRVVSDCFVRLTRGQSVLTGIGIESDTELRSYVIRSRVEGDLHEEDGAPLATRRARTPGR